MSFFSSPSYHERSESFMRNPSDSLSQSAVNSDSDTPEESASPNLPNSTSGSAHVHDSAYMSISKSGSGSQSISRSPNPRSRTPTVTVLSEFQSIFGTADLSILDLPIRITKHIFTFLPLDEMTTCMLVCSAWFNVLSDENMIVWRLLCRQRMKIRVQEADYLKLCPTFKSKLRALLHSWNPHDRSPNVSVVDGFILKRNQVPQSSDGCRTKIGFREGRHVWQIVIYDPLGSAAAVGVATRSTIMTKQGYAPLLGHDRHSWGWNLVENILYHKGDSHSYYPKDPKIKYKVGDILHVLLDCEDRTLSFKKNGEYLGIAFRDLPTPKKELFPSFCTVYGGSRASIVYLGMLNI